MARYAARSMQMHEAMQLSHPGTAFQAASGGLTLWQWCERKGGIFVYVGGEPLPPLE